MLGVLLSCLGVKTSLQLSLRALESHMSVKLGWTFLAALVAGAAIWTTQLLLIAAFHAQQSVDQDLTRTMLTLLLAVAGASAAFLVAGRARQGAMPIVGGGLLGLTIGITYHLGMSAYHLNGIPLAQSALSVAATALSAIIGASAMAVLHGGLGRSGGTGSATALVVTALIPLHLLDLLAVDAPFAAAEAPFATIDASSELSLAIALVATLIIGAGGIVHMIDDRTREETRKRIDAVALTDALTGLPNRAALDAELQRRAAAHAPGDIIAIVAIDIANIVSINQRHGIRIGDLTIQAIANRLLGARKQGVFLARTGGAEICGVGAVADMTEALDRVRKLHAALSNDLLIEAMDIAVDIRIGGALFPIDADEPDLLMRKAQIALARAKADPLEPTALHDDAEDAPARRRLTLANDLRGAVERGEFELFYQPQVWIADRRVIGYEALLRWRHPELGPVSPCEFIPIAEKTGAIVNIGIWALRTACAAAAAWTNGCRIAVNLSPLQLRQPDLPQLIERTLLASGLAPSRLEIELTESLLIEDRPRALHVLREIKALGVRLALDDFGTGHSSMDVLRHFPFDKVKLDKTFVDDVEKNRQARAILHAMLAMGRALGIPVLVEGVESERQLAILRKEGCNEVQGFLTGRPMPLADIAVQEPLRLSA